MTDREKLVKLLHDGNGHCRMVECRECEHFTTLAYCKDNIVADHLLANGVTFATDTNAGSKWISVEDEKPKTKNVIDGEVYYRNVVVLTEDKAIPEKIAYYNEGIGMWFQPLDIFPLRNVTHWMPLPPKEEPK